MVTPSVRPNPLRDFIRQRHPGLDADGVYRLIEERGMARRLRRPDIDAVMRGEAAAGNFRATLLLHILGATPEETRSLVKAQQTWLRERCPERLRVTR